MSASPPSDRRCWVCIRADLKAGKPQPPELDFGEACGAPDCSHVAAPTPDGLRPDLNIDKPWCAGMSSQYKVYWLGDSRDEVLDQARRDGETSCCVVETARYHEADAWEEVWLDEDEDDDRDAA